MVRRRNEKDASAGMEAFHQFTLSVVNESEEAVVFLHDLSVTGSRHGRHILDDDVRLEPRKRVERELLLDEEDHASFEEGWVARAALASGQDAQVRGTLDSEIDRMLRQYVETGGLSTSDTRHD